MTAPQFTPGPWSTKQYGYEKHSVTDERGTEIGFAHRRGDAHLIAAAPELYEALSAITTPTCFRNLAAGGEGTHGLAVRALAKARGEA